MNAGIRTSIRYCKVTLGRPRYRFDGDVIILTGESDPATVTDGELTTPDGQKFWFGSGTLEEFERFCFEHEGFK